MSVVRLRAVLRRLLVSFLNTLPDGAILAIKDGVTLRRRLDYQQCDIYLDIASSAEYFLRAQSCNKEPETIDWIETYVQEGEVVYDVGANVGAYALVACKFTKQKATVYAFEPGFANYSKLCRNILLNNCEKSIIPLPIALSDQTCVDLFRYSNLKPGCASHVLGSSHDTVAHGENQLSHATLTYSLDDLVQQFSVGHPNHIKIDVDGGELRVLRGAKAVLGQPSLRTLLVELDEAPSNTEEIIRLLECSGFQLRSRYRRPSVSNCVFVRCVN